MIASITYKSTGTPPDYIDRGRMMGEMDATLAAACTGRILLLDLAPLKVIGDSIERTATVEIVDDWQMP